MNQKKAKSIRRTMKRLFNRDAREVVIQPKKPVMGMFGASFNVNTGKREGGTPYVHWSGQHKLATDCARAEYQKIKRDYKEGRARGVTLLGPASVY